MSFAIFFVLWVSSLIGLSAASNEEGLKFLEENGKKPGVVTLPSGLQYKVLKRGVSEKEISPTGPSRSADPSSHHCLPLSLIALFATPAGR
jgi:hypothetical protein